MCDTTVSSEKAISKGIGNSIWYFNLNSIWFSFNSICFFFFSIQFGFPLIQLGFFFIFAVEFDMAKTNLDLRLALDKF